MYVFSVLQNVGGVPYADNRGNQGSPLPPPVLRLKQPYHFQLHEFLGFPVNIIGNSVYDVFLLIFELNGRDLKA